MSTKTLATTPAPAVAGRNRQIVYALGIVVLFGAMWPYSQWLQKVKTRTDLGEATIGQIDTAGFMVKLAMIGGARGLVANWLWMQAQELQRQHEWDQLMASVDLITKLQPHFLSVWTFQGWNLAYNVSVEWDAPEDKYTWIKKGINFLKDGVAKNQKAPDLLWDTAWTYYHKLGFADEAILFRGLFYRDPDDEGKEFKVDPISREPRLDNFQVAKGWFTRSVELVDQGNERAGGGTVGEVEYVDKQPQRKGRPGDLNFRAMPAHAQTRYAVALEKKSIKDVEPQFDQVARTEWERSFKDWVDFGRHEFPAFNHPDQMVRLDDATNPEEYAKLGENQRYWSSRWADQMNYPYWKERASSEMEPQGVQSRQLFYEGVVALKNGDYRLAITKYKQGLDFWKELLERHKIFRDDQLNQKDTGHLVKRYVFALKGAGLEIPDDLPFKEQYEMVKDETYLDPFDQLDMMRVQPRANAAPTGRAPAAAAAPAGR